MNTLTVDLGPRSYPIHIGSGLLAAGEYLREVLPSPQVAVITNQTVGPSYLGPLIQGSERSGLEVVATIQLPDGEQYKSLESLESAYDQLLAAKADRQTAVLALGGGVIGDLAGFVAATYQRGVPLIQIPTTLLAQVDAAVGGKTGVNHIRGKNMIGAFYQPWAVMADPDTLASLPERELRAGLAEVVKYGLIRDLPFFEFIETHLADILAREPHALEESIYISCYHKAAVVAADECEADQRALLNFGHTFAHAIETGTGYTHWLHGEAVSVGMVMAAEVSQRLGLLSGDERDRIQTVLKRAGLPVTGPPELDPEQYLGLMAVDKKVAGGCIRYVLLEHLGHAFVTETVSPSIVREAIVACT